jgi:membrane protease YdiL (CAAX protease family)
MELFKLNILISFVIVAAVFGAVHITTSNNWEMFFITFLSSLIYSFALIFLGILYAWMLHLSNNLIALFFYYSEKMKA